MNTKLPLSVMSLRDNREPLTFLSGRISTRLQRRKKKKKKAESWKIGTGRNEVVCPYYLGEGRIVGWGRDTSQTHGLTERGLKMACSLRQGKSGNFKGQVGRDTGTGGSRC